MCGDVVLIGIFPAEFFSSVFSCYATLLCASTTVQLNNSLCSLCCPVLALLMPARYQCIC